MYGPYFRHIFLQYKEVVRRVRTDYPKAMQSEIELVCKHKVRNARQAVRNAEGLVVPRKKRESESGSAPQVKKACGALCALTSNNTNVLLFSVHICLLSSQVHEYSSRVREFNNDNVAVHSK
jgi:hypothetical protein